MKNFYALFLFVCCFVQAVTAQTASEYFFRHKTGVAFADISTGATELFGANADDVVSGQIPFFPFTFSGKEYSSFSVSEDGAVILGTAVYKAFPYDDYFMQDDYSGRPQPAYPILLAWGEDLNTGQTGNIRYKITGTAPGRKLVIQFDVFSNEDYGDTQGLTGPVTKPFQVWLFEGSNQIQFVYGDVVYDWFNNAYIGIAGSASDFLSVNTLNNTVSSTETFYNGYYFELPPKGVLPVKGTAYIFSPSAIVDEPPAPPAPVTDISATVSILPEYNVSGQQKHTIYLGYGLPAVLLFAKATGGNPPATGYTYSWSPSTGLSDASVAWPVASPKVTTTYTVTIADGAGNTSKQSVTIYVMDVRCGDKGDKIITCKFEKGGSKQNCVALKDVEERLRKGEVLGTCRPVLPATATTSTASNTARLVSEIPSPVAYNTKIYPSPSSGLFTVQLPAFNGRTIVGVYDVTGSIVAQKVAGQDQQNVQFDFSGRSPGMYLIKTINNGNVRTGKIIIK